MADMMQSAATWFEAQRIKHLSFPVRYFQAGISYPLTCMATLVIGKWDAVNAAGQVVRMETRDFMISTADLPYEPKRNDQIVANENGIETTYRVIVPEGMQQAWRWTDRNNTLRRIHTMAVEHSQGA